MKSFIKHIIPLLFLLPVGFVISGVSVTRHDCTFCKHSDIDFFSIDDCCNENHQMLSCCNDKHEVAHEFHKCSHTVYMFSSVTTFSFQKFLTNTDVPVLNIINVNTLKHDFAYPVFSGKFYPPPLYISNCILRS